MGHRSNNRFKEGTRLDNRSNRPTEVSISRSKEASPTATRSERHRSSRHHSSRHRSSRLNNRTTLLLILLIIPKEGDINLRKGQKEVDQAAAEMKSGSINLLLVETAIPNRHLPSLLHLLPRTRNRHQRRPIW